MLISLHGKATDLLMILYGHFVTNECCRFTEHTAWTSPIACVTKAQNQAQVKLLCLFMISYCWPTLRADMHWFLMSVRPPSVVIPDVINPLESRGNYSATSNNMTLVHWPLMGGLLHLVQRGGDWAGPQPAQAPSRCTKCNSPPINGRCTNHLIDTIDSPFLCGFNVSIKC